MQPALDEAFVCVSVAQRVFQPRERTYHAHKRFANDEKDCAKMGKPKSQVPREIQPHPCAGPDQRQAAHNEQHKQNVDNKYYISQQHEHFWRNPIVFDRVSCGLTS